MFKIAHSSAASVLQFMNEKYVTDCWLTRRLRFTKKCLRQNNNAKNFNALSVEMLLVFEIFCMSIPLNRTQKMFSCFVVFLCSVLLSLIICLVYATKFGERKD